ncbi:hypothetical protein V3C99_014684, partial [Haemonchus contortus]
MYGSFCHQRLWTIVGTRINVV